MADTPNGETVTPESLSNDGQAAVTPVVNTATAEVEKLKKEAAQAQMAANQARNELDRIKQEQEATKQKQLLEKEEFKTLYEQTQSKLKEIEDTQAAQERQTELTAATNDVFKDYSSDTVELAKMAGLGLSEDSDSAKAILKEKLDAFQAKVGSGSPTVLSNNPRELAPNNVNTADLVARAHPGAESPMALASARGDITPQLEYIRGLKSIQKMREMSQQ